MAQGYGVIVIRSRYGPKFRSVECAHRGCALDDGFDRVANGIDPLLNRQLKIPKPDLSTSDIPLALCLMLPDIVVDLVSE